MWFKPAARLLQGFRNNEDVTVSETEDKKNDNSKSSLSLPLKITQKAALGFNSTLFSELYQRRDGIFHQIHEQFEKG